MNPVFNTLPTAPVEAWPPSLRSERSGSGSDILSIERWIAAFRRRWRIFATILLLGIALTLAYSVFQTPLYTGAAQVALNVRDEQLIDSRDTPKADLQVDRDASLVDTQAEILRSPRLAAWVVDSLQLANDPEFGGPQSQAPSLFSGHESARPAPAQRRQRALRKVRDRLSIVRVGATYVIEIRVKSEDPAKAARIADAFAQGYLLEQRRAKVAAKQEAAAWLQTRINSLRGQVQSAEAAVSQYRIANNLMTASGQNLTDQEISAYNQSAAQARATAAEADSRLRAARAQLAGGASGETMGEALNSVVIQNLRTQRGKASATLATLEGRYGPRHPELVRARQEVADIDAQIQQEVRRVLASLESNAAAEHGRLASIEGSVSSAKGALVSNSRAGIELAELERNAQAVRTLYEGFLTRYKEISSQEGITSADAQVVSLSPVPDAPTSPNLKMNMAIGALLSTALAIAAVLMRELSDSTLSGAEDVHRRLMLPYLGGIPLLQSVTKRRETPTAHVARCPTSGFAEAVRALGAAIRFSQTTPPKVILVTSALPNEGKTATSICLARSAALQGHRTLYVDCDLRRASGTAAIGLKPSQGLLEVLEGASALEAATYEDADTGASFLPLKLSPERSRDVFGLPEMDELLERLRKTYDLVILDTAPVLAVAETRILARKADAVALLAGWRQTPQAAVENALDILESVGAPVIGAALTRVDLRLQAATTIGDPAVYYKKYAQYYSETPRIEHFN